jgi:hypothetical protein
MSKRFMLTTLSLITYIDKNLLAPEGQVCTRDVFSGLCGMHTTIISDPSDVKRGAV